MAMSRSKALISARSFHVADRTKAYSDSVFAFASTAMVIPLTSISIPLITKGQFKEKRIVDLLFSPERVQNYAAYALTYCIVAVFWMRHVHLLSSFHRLSGSVISTNYMTLMAVCFFPFTVTSAAIWKFQRFTSLLAGNALLLAVSMLALTQVARLRVGGEARFTWRDAVEIAAIVLMFVTSFREEDPGHCYLALLIVPAAEALALLGRRWRWNAMRRRRQREGGGGGGDGVVSSLTTELFSWKKA
jgi:uncharacterized membrane protein